MNSLRGQPEHRSPKSTSRFLTSHFSLLTSVGLALLVTACSSKPPETKDYTSKIAADRAAKDAAFAAGDDPIPKARHAEFLPLAYFHIEPDYDVPAQLNRI